jgi:hypothetical protein
MLTGDGGRGNMKALFAAAAACPCSDEAPWLRVELATSRGRAGDAAPVVLPASERCRSSPAGTCADADGAPGTERAASSSRQKCSAPTRMATATALDAMMHLADSKFLRFAYTRVDWAVPYSPPAPRCSS